MKPNDEMAALDGLRALLVEDEALVALLLQSYLEEMGVGDVTLAHRLDAGLDAARNQAFDLAVLDVDLNGEKSFPIAEVLRERRVPFVFSSGFGAPAVAEWYPDAITLTKPYARQSLEEALGKALGAAGRGEP